MAEERKGRRGLRIACLGCVGLLTIVILVVAVFALVAWLRVRGEETTEHVLQPQIDDRPLEAPGRIVLELQHAAFHVRPAEPGQPFRVDATFDPDSCVLEEGEQEGAYRVRFHCTDSFLMAIVKSLFGGQQPEMEVWLPRDRPLELVLDVSQAGGEVELGGLSIRSADVKLGQGGFQLRVSEPVTAPLERLSVDASMAGVELSQIGNASPREIDVEFDMGGVALDLSGSWLHDALITIEGRMAGLQVTLPDDVRVEGLERPGPSLPASPESPLLKFDVQLHNAELEVNGR